MVSNLREYKISKKKALKKATHIGLKCIRVIILCSVDVRHKKSQGRTKFITK